MDNIKIKGKRNKVSPAIDINQKNINKSPEKVAPKKFKREKLNLEDKNENSSQNYAGPIMNSSKQSNSIIENQSSPLVSDIIITSIYPKELKCPFFKKKIKSEVKERFNFCTFFCYMYICIAIPISILQCNCENGCKPCYCCSNCDGKCCYDATHNCPKCGKTLGYYDSCSANFCPQTEKEESE